MNNPIRFPQAFFPVIVALAKLDGSDTAIDASCIVHVSSPFTGECTVIVNRYKESGTASHTHYVIDRYGKLDINVYTSEGRSEKKVTHEDVGEVARIAALVLIKNQ